MRRTKKVYRDRIGLNCFFDSMACLLEADKAAYLALNFVHHRFLYNRDSFLTFCKDQSLDKLLSPTDKYFFAQDEILNLRYKKDYISVVRKEFSESIGKKIKYNTFSEAFLDEIKCFNQDDFPISLRVNPKAYAEFYEENNCIIPRSDCRHRVNVYCIDKLENRAWMVDRGFNCLGAWIDLEYLYRGTVDEYLTRDKLSYSFIPSNVKIILDEKEILQLLKRNIYSSLQNEISINGQKYFINSDAFESFRTDLPGLIDELEFVSDGYAGQLLGEAFVQHIDETRSMDYLFDSANKYLDLIEIDDILPFFEQYKKLWLQFESLLRICVYKGESIRKRVSDFEKMADKMIKCNQEIMEKMKIVLLKLEK